MCTFTYLCFVFFFFVPPLYFSFPPPLHYFLFIFFFFFLLFSPGPPSRTAQNFALFFPSPPQFSFCTCEGPGASKHRQNSTSEQGGLHRPYRRFLREVRRERARCFFVSGDLNMYGPQWWHGIEAGLGGVQEDDDWKLWKS